MIRFRDYLKAQQPEDTPEGDFIEDALRDADFPDAKSLDELELYLLHRNAVPEAMEAARAVWLQFCASDPSSTDDRSSYD